MATNSLKLASALLLSASMMYMVPDIYIYATIHAPMTFTLESMVTQLLLSPFILPYLIGHVLLFVGMIVLLIKFVSWVWKH